MISSRIEDLSRRIQAGEVGLAEELNEALLEELQKGRRGVQSFSSNISDSTLPVIHTTEKIVLSTMKDKVALMQGDTGATWLDWLPSKKTSGNAHDRRKTYRRQLILLCGSVKAGRDAEEKWAQIRKDVSQSKGGGSIFGATIIMSDTVDRNGDVFSPGALRRGNQDPK